MANRSYDQYCPIAVALDELGDRWTLLILRELMLGERRFTDLRTALPGIAPNLLTDRLRDLQADGLVEQRELPPPAARTVYAATDTGRAVGPVLRSLARFGADRLGPPPANLTMGARRAVSSILLPFHQPDTERFHARLHLDGDIVDVVTDDGSVSLQPRDGEPDIELMLSVRDLILARQGDTSSLPAGESADHFRRLFQLT